MSWGFRICLLAALLACSHASMAAEPSADDAPLGSSALEGLLISALKQNIPSQYTDDSKWGRTKYQTVGLKIEREGLKLEVRRRKKQVNDGLWKLYRINLPESDQWEISFSELRDLGDGRAELDLTFATPLKVLARASNWEHGVQLFSISAQADAKVRLSLTCELRLLLVAGQLPPGLRLQPTVTHADLKIEQFELNRISQLHGPLVHELGEEAHDFLQKEVRERREKLTAKLNCQIEKHADKLTLSWAEVGSARWNFVSRLIPTKANDSRVLEQEEALPSLESHSVGND